jgi:hypothetical protein
VAGTGLVFTTHLGATLDAGNVRKMFKRVCEAAGAGDASTRTTEVVCRRELRPVITTGAEIMDELFGAN